MTKIKYLFLMLFLCFSHDLLARGLNHDSVPIILTGAEDSHREWAPVFHFEGGCVSAAAVDEFGNYNKGLKAAGKEGGNCRHLIGQTYARSVCRGNVCAYMYAMYFPKDNGFPFPSLGHRHDWEEIVVWTKNNEFMGAAYSQHGDYQKEGVNGDNNLAYGTHLKVKYKRHQFTHAFMPTNHIGYTPELVSWSRLPQAAKNTLNNHSFGKANCAINDARFRNKILQARLPGLPFQF